MRGITIHIFSGCCCEDRPGRRRAVSLNPTISDEINREDVFPQKEPKLEFEIRDGKKVLVNLQPTDRDGNVAAVQNASWSSSDTSLIVVTPVGDGNSAEVSTVPGPGLGRAVVSVNADADLGEGVSNLNEDIGFTVVPGDASALGVIVGPEEDRVDAPPVEEPPVEPPAEPPAEPPVE